MDHEADRRVTPGEAATHPVAPVIDRKAVHSALKAWHYPQKMGTHALARLRLVAAQRTAARHPDTPIGYGLALREVLRATIETLKPQGDAPDLSDPAWRHYLMLERRYVLGRPVDEVAEHLGLAYSTYQHEQALAMDLLAFALLAREQESGPVVTAPEPAAPVAAGAEMLGRYRRIRLCGEGAMAEVYEALQPGLDRRVALKLLRPHLARDPEFLGRFEREAAAVARLRHPNIVQVFDYDVAARGEGPAPYIVMEYIDGPTLESEIERLGEQGERTPPDETLRIIEALAAALDYAHGRGMVHHDVKPANIMFTAEGQVVLTDFGLAHLREGERHTEIGSVSGTAEYMAPEQARGQRGDRRSDVYALGAVLYELVTGRVPFSGDTPFAVIQQHLEAPPPPPRSINPDVAEAVEQVILKALAKSPEERQQTAGELAQGLRAALGLAETAPRPHRAAGPAPACPYRGLFAFREADAQYFFGRETLTERLVAAVSGQSGVGSPKSEVRSPKSGVGNPDFGLRTPDFGLIAVIGPSGSGKSSVVYAGLLPMLRQATELREAQGQGWLIADFRPGREPFHALAAALLPLLDEALSETDRLTEIHKLAQALGEGTFGLPAVIERILEKHPQAGRVLLAVDQFEELYTLCPEPETQRRFIDVLLEPGTAGVPPAPGSAGVSPAPGSQPAAAARSGRGRPRSNAACCLLTLRADFMGQALAHRPFADALQGATLNLGPMTRAELQRAIENPAAKQGYAFEAGLVERLLADVADEPGKLPLLEFALTALWEHPTDGLLTHEAYDAIGGVEGALARYADEVFARLSAAEQEQARRIFVQMVEPGEGTEDTRRVATRAELGDEHWPLVRRLADARLVVTDRDAAGMETVEVVHEALLRGWARLREWMDSDRAFRAWQERLRGNLRQWQESDRDEGALLAGTPLGVASNWLNERGADLSPAEARYIQDSQALQARQRRERQQRRQRVVLGLGAGFVVALVLAGIALFQRQDAVAQRQEAVLQRENSMRQAAVLLAGQAETELANGYHDRAVLLALAALENYPYTAQAEHALGQAVSYSRALGQYTAHQSAVTSVTWSPDGKRVASSGSSDNNVHIWDPATGETTRVIDMPKGITGNKFDMALHVQWTPDGQSLLIIAGDRYTLGSQDYDVLLWDAETGDLISSVEIANAAEPESGELTATFVTYPTGAAAEIAPRSGRLATLGGDNTALIWDAAWQKPTVVLSGHKQGVSSVDWSPDETKLATASLDGTARVWDTQSGKALYTLTGHDGWVNLALWSPDGTTLATAGEDGTLRLWNAQSGELVRGIETNAGAVSTLAWAPNGVRIVSGHRDGTLRIWEVATGKLLETLRGHQGIVSDLKWSPVDDRLASADGQGNVRMWNAAPSTAWRLYPPQAARGGDWTVQGASWSSDGRYLAMAGGDPFSGVEPIDPPSLEIWDVQANQLIMRNLGDALHLNGREAYFSPDDQAILYVGMGYMPDFSAWATAYVFDAHSGEIIRTFTPGGEILIRSVAWSSDGSQIATGLTRGETYLLNNLG